jgi:hypothetical protein
MVSSSSWGRSSKVAFTAVLVIFGTRIWGVGDVGVPPNEGERPRSGDVNIQPKYYRVPLRIFVARPDRLNI